MLNAIWIIILLSLGAWMLVGGISQLIAGSIAWGVVYILIAALNIGVAFWRVVDN